MTTLITAAKETRVSATYIHIFIFLLIGLRTTGPWVKSKMATTFGDVTGPQQCNHQ